MKKLIEVKVPESFLWVLSYWIEWNEKNKNGEITLIFKDGGVCGLKKLDLEKPPQ